MHEIQTWGTISSQELLKAGIYYSRTVRFSTEKSEKNTAMSQNRLKSSPSRHSNSGITLHSPEGFCIFMLALLLKTLKMMEVLENGGVDISLTMPSVKRER